MVEIPTVNAFVRWTIELLNPEIETVSWSFISKNGEYVAVTVLPVFHVNTAFSNLVNSVLTLEIPIPTRDLTCPLSPTPKVPASLKSVKSPTLYPSPPSNTCKSSISPVVTDSTVVNCLKNSLDSTIKSLSAKAYQLCMGKYFLLNWKY